MKVYLLNGKEKSLKTEFASKLANHLSKDKKTLLVGVKRLKDKNIEDYYQKDGMITYDLCDYFLGYVELSYVINKAYENLDFIISPFTDKYEIKKEDIKKLLENTSYDYVIFDGLDENFLDEKTSIKLINEDQVEEDIDSDFYFINQVDKNFDHRLYKEKLLNKNSKYLGFVYKNASYEEIVENLLEEKAQSIPNIGFFEKIKMKLAQ